MVHFGKYGGISDGRCRRDRGSLEISGLGLGLPGWSLMSVSWARIVNRAS